MNAICEFNRVKLYRQLKQQRDRLIELEKAIEDFPGICESSELMMLGGLRGKHSVTMMRINELTEQLSTHE